MTPRKPNQPTLTREQIVEAAIGVVDREGLAALSMRKVASALGMSPMSLYYHVPDKSALYDLILDAVMSDIDLSVDDPSQTLEERVIAGFYALREALMRHPNAVPLALSRSMRTRAQMRPVEVLLGAMLEAGLTATEAVTAVDVVGQYTFGTTMAYANHVTNSEYHDDARDRDFSDLTADEFPNMAHALEVGEYIGFDGEFDRGLRVLVHGLLSGEGER
jgi:TetR/AcrR family transcriptional regulator, tetracycline repressor protein